MENTVSLKRTLTLAPVVLFGISFMAIGTVFSTYGIAAQITDGVVAGAYVLTLMAMLLTANSYGKMSRAYPFSGSAYTYAQKSIGPRVGFLVGWAILIDYLFIPMVNFLVFSIFFEAQFPQVPSYVWILAMLLVVTFINVRGIKMASRVNLLISIFGFLFILIFCVLAVKKVMEGVGTGSLITTYPFFHHGITPSHVLTGVALLCFSFLGFDSVTTFAEETIQPTKTIPRAIMIVTLLGGVVFIVVSYLCYTVFPDHTKFQNADAGSFDIIILVGGTFLKSTFLAFIAVGCFASAMVSQASVGRIMYAMGKDEVLPKKFFGYIHPKYQTPILNILIVSAISLTALFMNLETVALFINFGALVAFTFVNLSVFFHYFIRQRERTFLGILSYMLLPLAGVAVNIWLLIGLDGHSKTLGSLWLLAGFIYLLVLTKGFSKKTPELKLNESYEV
ncbi:APC family permease [Ammoniphilus sp. YIM 78166]|uniref:APC family permease n=1 Tax=Ammoniphilus sp. YIM 78166 TaxID=1644106 RepID=UPI00106FB882|nr:APC family permease [Ammoniphilus sp. YIM 78166]